MTFEEYLRQELARSGAIDFRFRATVNADGSVSFYVHPLGKDGDTRDFIVSGNTLTTDPRVPRIDDTPS
jgi:hypothetical protein